MGGRHHRLVRLRLLLGLWFAVHALRARRWFRVSAARSCGYRWGRRSSRWVALSTTGLIEGTAAARRVPAEGVGAATFPPAGEQVERYPKLAAETVAMDTAPRLHCHRHRNQLRLAPGAIVDDMRRGEAAISEACGRAPRLYRPPYGIFSASRAGHRAAPLPTPALDPLGTGLVPYATAESIALTATRHIRAGDVILLHEADHYSAPGSWRRTVAAVPRILESLASGGHAAVAINDGWS